MKKIYLFKLAALILQSAFVITLIAQSPLPKQWDKRFGTLLAEENKALQQTADGGYILGGSTSAGISGDKTEDTRGKSDYWVIKVDATGIKQWDKRYGGAKYDDLTCLQQTTDGGYILGGNSNSDSSYDKSENSRGSNDYWIVKIDANGNKQWDKRFGGRQDDHLAALQQTSDGGYILGGDSDSGPTGDKTEPERGYNDYWIIKTDASGNKQWDKCFGGSDYENLFSVKQTTDGGYILGGQSHSGISGDKTEASRGTWDYWIVKTNSLGSKEWDKRYGGTDVDGFYSLQQTTDGGYMLAGQSYSGTGGDKTQSNRGGPYTGDYWVVKIDAAGAKQWDNRYGGDNDDRLHSMQQTTDEGYILGGYSVSDSSFDKSQAGRGFTDYWVVKIDKKGVESWDARFGGSYLEELNSLQQTTDGGYILGGFSESGVDGDKTQQSRGYSDFWVVKLGCPPSAKVKALGSLDICATGSVTLIADHSAGVQYQWYKDGAKIEDAKDRTYTVTEPGRYRVRVGTDWQCGQFSNQIHVTNSCGKTENSISISPNPSHGIVNITYNSSKTSNIQLNVFDKTGKLMFTKTEYATKGNNTYQLNLSNLINGVYNLQIINAVEQQQVKFIIVK